MVSDKVRDELATPVVIAAIILIVAGTGYGIFLAHGLGFAWPLISLVVPLYLIYLFIRMVGAVEEMAYET